MTTFKPQLARNIDLEKVTFPCAVQKKWDGERLLHKGDLLSRSMKPIRNQWLRGELASAAAAVMLATDGEIQIDGDFQKTQGFIQSSDREGSFIYHVFDAPIEGKTFEQRHAMLSEAVQNVDDPRIKIVPYVVVESMVELMVLHAENITNPSLDGTIVRNLDSLYKCGRSTIKEGQALKIKEFDDDEGTIIGFTERMHNTNVAQTNELGRTFRSSAKEGLEPTGSLGTYTVSWRDVEFQVTATGDLPSRKRRWEERDVYLGKLVKFKYMGLTRDGIPRHPTELGIRSREDLS